MRRRLINSTLAVVLVVIGVFGVSLVLVETRTITSSAEQSVKAEALRLANIVDSRIIGGEPSTAPSSPNRSAADGTYGSRSRDGPTLRSATAPAAA